MIGKNSNLQLLVGRKQAQLCLGSCVLSLPTVVAASYVARHLKTRGASWSVVRAEIQDGEPDAAARRAALSAVPERGLYR